MSEWASHAIVYCAGAAIGFVIGGCVVLLLTGCYFEHAAEPCDSGARGSKVGHEGVDLGYAGSSPVEPPDTYPGPCPFAYDHVHCWCVDATHEVCGAPCAGPVVAGECYASLEDWLSQ